MLTNQNCYFNLTFVRRSVCLVINPKKGGGGKVAHRIFDDMPLRM